MTTQNDVQYMQKALRLAQNGAGWVAPNPLVGAVIVKDGVVIGQGWHAEYGGSHAEVKAIQDAQSKGYSLIGTTIYVTLEPCNHHGSTPPCTDAILSSGIARVVYAVADPNPHVAGNGHGALAYNGIKVVAGVLVDEARYQNRIFFQCVQNQQPYIAIKVGVSADDKLTKKIGTATQITNKTSERYSHILRQMFDAILVGYNTVRIDNPKLTTRYVPSTIERPRDPLRIIIDPRAEIPLESAVLKDENYLVVVSDGVDEAKVQSIAARGGQVVQLHADTDAHFAISDLVHLFWELKITSVLVEGGQGALDSFVHAPEFVQEWILIRSTTPFGTGLDFIRDPKYFYDRFSLDRTEDSDGDTIEYYHPKQ